MHCQCACIYNKNIIKTSLVFLRKLLPRNMMPGNIVLVYLIAYEKMAYYRVTYVWLNIHFS